MNTKHAPAFAVVILATVTFSAAHSQIARIEAQPKADQASNAETVENAAESSTLFLANGDYLPGQFVAHEEPGQILWRTELFTEPATFELSGVDRVMFGKITAPPKPVVATPAATGRQNPVVGVLNRLSKFLSTPPKKTATNSKIEKKPINLGTRIQTLDGNVFFGSIRSMDQQWLSLRSERHGEFRIATPAIERMDGFSESQSGLFDVVSGFQNATSIGAKRKLEDWDPSGGRISTKQTGANLFIKNVHKGPLLVELVVSSEKGTPSFLLTMGVQNNDRLLKNGFSVETWGERFVAHRQNLDELKHTELQNPELDDGRLRLQLFLDTAQGRLIVYSQSRKLGEFTDNATTSSNAGVYLRNNGDDLTIHQFRAQAWNGRSTPLPPSEKHVVQTVEGKQVSGTVTEISEDGILKFESEAENTTQIPLSQIDQIVFSETDDSTDIRTNSGNVRVDYLEGSVIHGRYLGATDDGLVLAVENVESPLQVGWMSMARVQWRAESTSTPRRETTGVIERTSHRLHGNVVQADADGAIMWQPYGSNVAIPLNLDSKSKVTFDSVAASTIDPSLTDELHLVNGDIIPCRLLSVDEESVHVQLADGTQSAVRRAVFKGIRRRPGESYVYRGIDDDEVWHASSNDSRAVVLDEGVLELRKPIFLSRDVNLPERACISFDAEWTGDCSLILGFGADDAYEAARRMDANYGYSSKLMEEEAKRRRDFYGEVSLTRSGKGLTARGYLRSSGLTGRMFANNNMLFMGRGTQSNSTLALGETPTVNIDIFLDRPRRSYAVVANGKTLHAWKESARLDGPAIYLGMQKANANAPNFGMGATVKKSESNEGYVKLSNLRVARWPGAVPDDRKDRLLTRRLGARPKATTHILRAFNGDSLRGQLVSVQNNSVMFKSRLDTIAIPLDKVAEIIALRKESKIVTSNPFSLELHGGGSVVMKPVQVTNEFMVGDSPAVGRIAIPWRVVSQLNVGGTFQRSLSDLVAWKLKAPPALPDFLNGSNGDEPTDSPMIGKPAPELKLRMLDDSTVTLADLRGKTVVLDFWATWCGPCVASLPRVMEVASGFEDDVVLIAVNQQEDPDTVKSFLASHDWDNLTVALDDDSVASRFFRVEAIPYTVIIDGEGIVRNVHVGASADLATTLSEEIEATLAATP